MLITVSHIWHDDIKKYIFHVIMPHFTWQYINIAMTWILYVHICTAAAQIRTQHTHMYTFYIHRDTVSQHISSHVYNTATYTRCHCSDACLCSLHCSRQQCLWTCLIISLQYVWLKRWRHRLSLHQLTHKHAGESDHDDNSLCSDKVWFFLFIFGITTASFAAI